MLLPAALLPAVLLPAVLLTAVLLAFLAFLLLLQFIPRVHSSLLLKDDV